MTMIRTMMTLMMALGLGACAAVEPASRGTTAPQLQFALVGAATGQPGLQVMQSQYRVAEVRVSVPRALKASEANTFHPNADIVWRGDGKGDRHMQVSAIVNEAMLVGTAGMATGPEVIVEVVVTRFHCLTEKTRYTVGGVHSMKFDLTVRDAVTGAVLDGPRAVVADTKAAVGAAALAEDQAGRTQKVVVTERLAEVIRRELSVPASGPAVEAALVARAANTTIGTQTGL